MSEKLTQDPGEKALKQSLKRSFDKDKNIKLSQDEVERLEKAFEDKKFRDLMAEYVNEISDPKHRAEQDSYIRQLEEHNDIPDGKSILRPRSGFVLKFKYTKREKGGPQRGQSFNPKKNHSKKSKIFINIVHSDMLAKPTSEAVPIQDNSSDGKQWSLPYSFGPLRMEHDKDKSLVPTFDCCFHPQVLLHASKSTAFRNLVAETARSGAAQHYRNIDEQVDIDTNYHILKGTLYKNGNPPVMVQGGTKRSTVSRHDEQTGYTTKTAGHGSTKKRTIITGEKQLPAISESSFVSNLKKGFTKLSKPSGKNVSRDKSITLLHTKKRFTGMNRIVSKLPDCRYIPEYKMIERGEFDLADVTVIEGLKQPSRRPKSLIFKISLPGISSSSSVDLDISEGRLELKSLPGIKRRYNLEVKLPYPVNHNAGTAKFDKASSMLTVILPVHKPPTSSFTMSPVVTASVADNVEISKNTRDDIKKNIDEAMIGPESPVWVEMPTKLDQKSDLLKPPVLVKNGRSLGDRDIDCHSRWISVEKVTHVKSVREDFARDAVLPTLNKISKEKAYRKENDPNGENIAGEDTSTVHKAIKQNEGGAVNKYSEVTKNSEDENLVDIPLTATDEKQITLIPPYSSQNELDIKVPSPFFKNNIMFVLD